MSRPAPIRIDDLARPRFSPEVEQIFDFLAQQGRSVALEPDALLKAAIEQSGGLDDFGDDPSFEERLDVLCRALRDEAGLSDAGVGATHAQLVGHLVNRLRVEDLLRRHPEIDDVEISRPIVVCGLQRTGTTHLHNLMSSDPALRSLPYWESLEPVLAPADAGADPDPRLERAAMSVGLVDAAMPEFKRMHEMTVDHVHEEIQLLGNDVSGMLVETIAPMPTWRDHYLARDQTPTYEYLKRTLKVLTWLRGGTRWLLKSPQHIEQFVPLSTVFPDATFVVTHRDPVAVTLSTATMLAYSARMRMDPVDPVHIGRYWADRTERMLRACVRDRDVLPADRTIDVRFHEFMADDVAMVERIYEVAGQPFDDGVRRAMERFMADHERGRHGGVVYDAADFGLDEDERYEALRFYIDRFHVAVERR